MRLTDSLQREIRDRAHGACEYCGVTETDSRGHLTVDHFKPQSHGGTDDPSNLLYCCWRCNLYKADYWPTTE
jgi:5-methylcytosine-specific restriction endonuclease McrA